MCLRFGFSYFIRGAFLVWIAFWKALFFILFLSLKHILEYLGHPGHTFSLIARRRQAYLVTPSPPWKHFPGLMNSANGKTILLRRRVSHVHAQAVGIFNIIVHACSQRVCSQTHSLCKKLYSSSDANHTSPQFLLTSALIPVNGPSECALHTFAERMLQALFPEHQLHRLIPRLDYLGLLLQCLRSTQAFLKAI